MAAPDHRRLCPLDSGRRRKSRKILTLARVTSRACLVSSCPLARSSASGREKEETGLVMKIATPPSSFAEGDPENRGRCEPYFTTQRVKAGVWSDFGSAILTCKRHIVLDSPRRRPAGCSDARGMWTVSPSPQPSPARGEGVKGTNRYILYILNRAHGLHPAKVSGEGGFGEALEKDVHHGHKPDTSLTYSPTILHPAYLHPAYS